MKKLLYLLTALCIAFAMVCPCYAGSSAANDPTLPRVVDNAELLQPQEESYLEEQIKMLTDKHGMDILIYIEDYHGHTQGADDNMIFFEDEHHAEDIWDSLGYGVGEDRSGWMIYICMESGYLLDDSAGRAEEFHNYNTANILEDFMIEYFSAGDFFNGFIVGLSQLDQLFTVGAQNYVSSAEKPIYTPGYEEETDTSQDQFGREDIVNGVTYGGIVGLVAGLINLLTAKSSMKTVRPAIDANEYEVGRSLDITEAQDILINVRVTREEKPDNNDRGGYSHSGSSGFNSSHTSSGGVSHTSSGRHF